MNGELHVDLDEADFLAVFPLKANGHARLVGTVREAAARDPTALKFEDVQDRAIRGLRIEVERVNWFSTYRVHHRVADRFHRGRAFLLGDAAHIHSPVGGQGMNTGIGDAVNLAWKLAAVLKDHADTRLLDSYEPERIAFARRLVATTDRAFTGVINPSVLARFVRTKVLPGVVSRVFETPLLRRLLFRTISQINVNYRGGPLSEGRASNIWGGDRLPFVAWHADGISDNYAPLASLRWQIHVYGDATPGLGALAARRDIPLHRFPWPPRLSASGRVRNAIYLIRPDGYIALAGARTSAAEIENYLSAHGYRTVAAL